MGGPPVEPSSCHDSVSFLLRQRLRPTTAPPRNVIIDVGANCGNSYKELLGKQPKLDTPSMRAFLWEANPMLTENKLKPLAAKDARVTIMHGAVSTASYTAALSASGGCATFYLDARTSSSTHSSSTSPSRRKNTGYDRFGP